MLNTGDRLLILAPHPDDETLGTGGLLQEAVGAGIPLRVLLLTSGERNPWAQRVVERRLFLDTSAQARFASLRHAETSEALDALGVPKQAARFLELPDQGLTNLLLDNPDRLVPLLRNQLAEFGPSLVVGPSYWDLHPDHSALAVALDLAMAGLPAGAQPGAVWHFLVHHPILRDRRLSGTAVSLSSAVQERKRAAIVSHRSQHAWRGRWLMGFAAAEETFIDPQSEPPDAPARISKREEGWLWIDLVTRPRVRAFGRRTLHLLSAAPGGEVRSVSFALPPWPGRITGRSRYPACPDETLRGWYRGGPRRGTAEIPVAWCAPGHAVYAKISRRFGFFDEAGWTPLARPDARH